MTNKFSNILQGVKKVFFSKGATIVLAIISIILGVAVFMILTDRAKTGVKDNVKTNEESSVAHVSPTTLADKSDSKQDKDSSKDSKTDSNNKSKDNNKGTNSPFIKIPKVKLPPTSTPTPTSTNGSGGLNIDPNLLNSVSIKDKMTGNVPNIKHYVYAWYMGLGRDFDPSFPQDSHVFLSLDLDKDENIIEHVYIFNNNAFAQKPEKSALYGVAYYSSDEVSVFKDQEFVFHTLSKVDSYDKQAYPNYFFGVYKGKASEILDPRYIGYADLQAKWSGDTVHFLVPMAKTPFVQYKKGEVYAFIVEDYDEDNRSNPWIVVAKGKLVYLPDVK